ncbi:MAG: hypothetical protein MJ180_05980 [Candidatus Gastranaerophilales bacterium]|nr:hypothetical protein [Candidatus Gastranaerophilales bacterium]
MAIDGINPFQSYNTNLGINQQVGGQGGQPKVNPFREIQPVEGPKEVGRGEAFAGFNPTKWVEGCSGLKQGALGEDGAVSSYNLGHKPTKLGARLNFIDGAYQF